MKLEKAIEIKEQYLKDNQPYDLADLEDADRLGTEAMKRLKELRTGKTFSPSISLPGETKD